MDRDASPVRRPRAKAAGFRPCCSKTDQQLLLYFGCVLACDQPILEALFYSSLALIGLQSGAPLDTLLQIVASRVPHVCPHWTVDSERESSIVFINPDAALRITFNVFVNHGPWIGGIEILRNNRWRASIVIKEGHLRVFFKYGTPLRLYTFEQQLDALLIVLYNALDDDDYSVLHQIYADDMAALHKKISRPFDVRFLHPACTDSNQQRLLYFGTVLDCNSAILKALFFAPSMHFLRSAVKCVNRFLQREIATRFALLYPHWTRVLPFHFNNNDEGYTLLFVCWFDAVGISCNGRVVGSICAPTPSFHPARWSPLLHFGEFESQIDNKLRTIMNYL
jgi:hypothetical protein